MDIFNKNKDPGYYAYEIRRSGAHNLWKTAREGEGPSIYARLGENETYLRSLQTWEDEKDAGKGEGDGNHLVAPYFDLDGNTEEEKECARQEVILIFDYFLGLGVGENEIQAVFSGKKGFALLFNPHAFKIEYGLWNTKANKIIAETFKEKKNLKQLDLTIYSKRRLIRIPGQKHEDTGLYRIPLSKKELGELSLAEIRELAKKPREVILHETEAREGKPAEFWRAAIAEAQNKEERKAEESFTSTNSKAELSTRLKLMMENGARGGSRNATRYEMLKDFYRLGIGEDRATLLLFEFNQNCTPKDDEEKIRNHVKQTYQQLREEKQITPNRTQGFYTIPAWELVKKEFGEREWIAEGIIPKVGITFLAGKKGVKKTFSALELALCVAEGKPFFGKFPTKARHVLYFDAEGGEYTCWERLNKLRKEIPKDLNLSFYPKLCLDKAEGGPLEEYLSTHRDCLVIIDALRRVLEVDENDAKAINDVFMPLKRFCDKYGATFVIIHHLRKGMIGRYNDDASDEMRGSSDLGNIADSVLIIEKVKDSPNALILKQSKNRVGIEMKPCRIELNETEGMFSFAYVGDWEEDQVQAEKAGRALLEWLYLTKKKDFTTREAKEELKTKSFSEKTTTRALTALVEGNRLIRESKGHYVVPSGTLTDFSGEEDALGTTGQKGQDKGLGRDGSA